MFLATFPEANIVAYGQGLLEALRQLDLCHTNVLGLMAHEQQ